MSGSLLERLEENAVQSDLAGVPTTYTLRKRAVEMLADFNDLTVVQKMLMEEFGITLDRRALDALNPDSPRCRMGKQLRELFAERRAAAIHGMERLAFAHQTQRVKAIQRIVGKAETRREFDVALKGLRQIAEELGGKLTNETIVSGQIAHAHVHLSLDDARAELALRLAGQIENDPMLIDAKPLRDKDIPPTDGGGLPL